MLHIKYVVLAPNYLDFDFKLTSVAKIQPVFQNTGGKTFSYHGHALVYALICILKVVYFDS